MSYNIHPIFVHFPIALLVIYSVLKAIPLDRWFPGVSWKHIERILLVLGVLGAFAALATGETAEHLTRPNRQLVEYHSFFAGLSTWLYGALLAGELAAMLGAWKRLSEERFASVRKALGIIERILCGKAISVSLAVLALVSISITGLLGGALVYGSTADPIAAWMLRLLGISL